MCWAVPKLSPWWQPMHLSNRRPAELAVFSPVLKHTVNELNAIQPENRAQNNSNKLKSSHESRVFRETEKFLRLLLLLLLLMLRLLLLRLFPPLFWALNSFSLWAIIRSWSAAKISETNLNKEHASCPYSCFIIRISEMLFRSRWSSI